jgi:hypothetical protein
MLPAYVKCANPGCVDILGERSVIYVAPEDRDQPLFRIICPKCDERAGVFVAVAQQRGKLYA